MFRCNFACLCNVCMFAYYKHCILCVDLEFMFIELHATDRVDDYVCRDRRCIMIRNAHMRKTPVMNHLND